MRKSTAKGHKRGQGLDLGVRLRLRSSATSYPTAVVGPPHGVGYLKIPVWYQEIPVECKVHTADLKR